jgi:peptide/nickel transport system substrate-binding protein
VLDFAALDKAIRVDGNDVVITLPRPFGPFLGIMARWSYVMSKPWAIAHGEWDGTAANWRNFNDPPKEKSYFYEHMNGAGPFKLARWDKTARYVLLARHDAYFRGPAKFKQVLVKAVPELNTRKLMLQAGDADIIETPRPYASQLKGMPGVIRRCSSPSRSTPSPTRTSARASSTARGFRPTSSPTPTCAGASPTPSITRRS